MVYYSLREPDSKGLMEWFCLLLLSLRIKKVLTAQAEAEKIKRIGEAEAGSIEAVGKAEAEKMRLKAEAYQQYGEAAKTALVLEALPKVCGSLGTYSKFDYSNYRCSMSQFFLFLITLVRPLQHYQ